MSATLVIQSHRDPLPFEWLRLCLDSVTSWAQDNQFELRFLGDELFDLIEPGLFEKIGAQTVIASDLARLKNLQQGDPIEVEDRRGLRHSYRVRECAVLDREDGWALAPAGSAELILVTCWPFDAVIPGGSQRYVVWAD